MANISNVQGNIPLVKSAYKKWLSHGEKVTGNEYRMVIEGYPDLTYMVSTVNLPALQREMVEAFGTHGVKFMQQGRFVNAQDISITFDEVITGKMYEAIRDWVKNKKYLKVTLGLVSENQPTSSPASTVVCDDCWLELEAVELGNENGATLVKPSGTLHANWVSWLDDAGDTVSME